MRRAQGDFILRHLHKPVVIIRNEYPDRRPATAHFSNTARRRAPIIAAGYSDLTTMLLQQALPGNDLARWIHSYRQYRFTPTDSAHLSCLPGTGGELWLPDRGQLADEQKPLGGGLLCLRSRRLNLHQVDLRIFSIRFRAGALPFFTDRTLAELIDAYTPVDALYDEDSRRQLTALQGSAHFAEQCLLAERFLLARRRAGRRLETTQRLAGVIYEESRDFALGEHAARLRHDRSALSRQFRESQGCSAKHFHRLCRFERFLRDALYSDERSLAGLAIDHGYYDQAHMQHEVRTFARQSPRVLLAYAESRLFYSPRPG